MVQNREATGPDPERQMTRDWQALGMRGTTKAHGTLRSAERAASRSSSGALTEPLSR